MKRDAPLTKKVTVAQLEQVAAIVRQAPDRISRFRSARNKEEHEAVRLDMTDAHRRLTKIVGPLDADQTPT